MQWSCEERRLAQGVPGRQARCLQRPLEGHRGLRGSSRTSRHCRRYPAAQQRVRLAQHTGMRCSGCSETHPRRGRLQGRPPPRQPAAFSGAHCEHKLLPPGNDETALLAPVVWCRTGVEHTQPWLRLSTRLSVTALQVLQTRRVPLACGRPSAPSAREPERALPGLRPAHAAPTPSLTAAQQDRTCRLPLSQLSPAAWWPRAPHAGCWAG
jgi:hypothetical protein